ncbi:hypothetical protein A2U01_0095302, partial [Trifolium medium]|nr:hypothetical protein [Trifolium medium]
RPRGIASEPGPQRQHSESAYCLQSQFFILVDKILQRWFQHICFS